MVDYTRWVSIMFEVHGDSNPATTVMEVAGSEWSERKQALRDASVSEARAHAKSL